MRFEEFEAYRALDLSGFDEEKAINELCKGIVYCSAW